MVRPRPIEGEATGTTLGSKATDGIRYPIKINVHSLNHQYGSYIEVNNNEPQMEPQHNITLLCS